MSHRCLAPFAFAIALGIAAFLTLNVDVTLGAVETKPPSAAGSPPSSPLVTGSASAPSIDGAWRWSFTMPDGTTSQPKLVLENEDGALVGTSSFRPGTETSITNAVLQGNQVRFQVVRHRGEREIVTSYSGTWTGSVIRGKAESNWAGPVQVYPWEAHRAHEGAEGVWKWTASLRGRKFEALVKLAQDGELLTGSVPGSGRGARRIRISQGSVKDGEVLFEIERGAGATKVVTVYKGKQTGDTIKGTITTIAGGRKQEAPWEARRAD